MASSGAKAVVILVLAASAAAAGAWAWTAHQRAELRRTAAALVQEASAGLRDGLRAHPGGSAAAGKLEADARGLDQRLAEFGRVRTARQRALAYAAEEYAVSARQILRELAREDLGRERVADGIKALAQHMNYADRRTPDFHRRALELKSDLEKRYFDYGVAAGALARELDAFPDARAKLAAELDASALLDEGLAADARNRAAESARRLADDMQRARRMAGAR
jgi:hypothetical protein